MQTTTPKAFVRIVTPIERSTSSRAVSQGVFERFLAVLMRSMSAWCV